jgi:hypothetical protein
MRSPESSKESVTENDQSAPSFWQRHDVGVLIFALAIFAGGTQLTRKLATPELIDFDQDGLHFQRPSGWLPGQQPTLKAAGLANTAAGFGVNAAPTKPPAQDFHILYHSARDARQRIEVRIRPRPGYGNLRGVRAVERLGRYGEFYWEKQSRERSIARRDWLRTEFRYAFKPSKSGSPQIANAVEYATLQDKRLYVVTLHGNSRAMNELDRSVSPTLRIEDLASVEATR